MNPNTIVFAAEGRSTHLLDYVLERLSTHGEVVIALLTEPSQEYRSIAERYRATVTVMPPSSTDDTAALCSKIVNISRNVGAAAIITFSEFLTSACALACAELGLRGPGKNVRTTRDKYQMRLAFSAAGIRSPRYAHVNSEQSLLDAGNVLGYPFLLKVSGGSFSVGHVIPSSAEEAVALWNQSRAGISQWEMPANDEIDVNDFIAEEIICASAKDWFGDQRFGDYVSVEGLVCDGTYFPIAIVTRLPSVYPFTERGNHAPCLLPLQMQHAIADEARRAVDAIKLETCATHTELKLLANGGVCAIETSARFGGTNYFQVDRVYGVDMVNLLAEALLTGHTHDIPSLKTGPGRLATGLLALMPVDVNGLPYPHELIFKEDLDWKSLVASSTSVAATWLKPLSDGEAIPHYVPALGGFNIFGLLYLESSGLDALVEDQYRILKAVPKLFSPEAFSHS